MTEEAMNEGSMTHDVTNTNGALVAPRCVAWSSGRQPAADRPVDEVTFVVVDTRGRQINPLSTTMTVAEALDDALGPRR